MKAIVVGAGFGGIAAALRLRAKGYEVTLIDRCADIGGRAQVFERNGFRHDAGPTVITAPFLFEELFSLFDEKLEDHVKLVPLTPWYRFVFADQTTFDYGGTLEQTLAEIHRIEPADCVGYKKLLAQSKRIFEVGFVELSAQPFHQFKTMLAQIPRLVGLGSYKTVWGLVCSYLQNPKLRQAFSIQPLLVGGNPFDTTSIYGLIHYLERSYGVYFAMGGTGAITKALSDLMQRHGITIELGTTVEQILVENGVAQGVLLEGGQVIDADVIVSNADPAFLYSKMIEPKKQAIMTRSKLKAASYSMGLFVLYFGTTRQYPEVAHHTIWMGERYRELLEDIFDKKILTEDFSLYLHRPTATDPSFAPEGCDSFYVLCPVPNLQAEIDWAVEGPKLQSRIVAALDRTILPGLTETITSDFFMTPQDFKTDYLSQFGAGFSIAPLFRQSAWFRFHNKAEGIKNLYLVGAGTHPGAGMPGVLCSAKVIDNLIPSVNPIEEAGSKEHSVLRSHLVQAPSEAILAVAENTLAKKGRSFYWARFFMSAQQASNATRLYSFCRYLDDLVDEEHSAEKATQAIEMARVEITAGHSTQPVIQDGIDLMRECHIDLAVVLDLIDGIQSDIRLKQIENDAALLKYCYQVAGTVGLMMCKVLNVSDPTALRHAVDLGIAMQLTNICRDVADDAKVGRCYLPISMVGEVSMAQLINPDLETQVLVINGIARMLKKADQYYASGQNGFSYLPLGARSSILVAARVYQAIGAQLKKNKFNYWQQRAVVSSPQKILVTTIAFIQAIFTRSFWRPLGYLNTAKQRPFSDFFI
jgi:phytoene desaturase